MTSFDLPKQSHRVLPVPKLETKKASHNANLAQSKTKNDSNNLLPTLKALQESANAPSSIENGPETI